MKDKGRRQGDATLSSTRAACSRMQWPRKYEIISQQCQCSVQKSQVYWSRIPRFIGLIDYSLTVQPFWLQAVGLLIGKWDLV